MAQDTQEATAAEVDVEVAPGNDRAAREETKRAAATEAFARGHEGLTEENERDALEWLLGSTAPMEYDVSADFETPEGPAKLKFVIRQLDGRKIDEIEQRHVSESTGRIDRIAADCEIVATACVGISGLGDRMLRPGDQEFRTVMGRDRRGDPEPKVLASPGEAIEQRFRRQLGIVFGIAAEIRRISGFDTTKVGTATRRLVSAEMESLTRAAGN